MLMSVLDPAFTRFRDITNLKYILIQVWFSELYWVIDLQFEVKIPNSKAG